MAVRGGANFAVNPVNGNDVVISSNVGRIFATTNQGVNWFDIGDPAVFGSPGSFSVALAYGAPDPNAPEGIGNLGNFIYVGTQTGQIYVTQDGGGSGTSNNWLNISTGLDGSAVQSIITDPTRGSHDAYAVTTTGVFYLEDSILLANNPTNTRTVGQHHRQHPQPALHHLRPELRPDDRPERGQATTRPNRCHVDRGRLAVHDPQRRQRPHWSGVPPGAVRRRQFGRVPVARRRP